IPRGVGMGIHAVGYAVGSPAGVGDAAPAVGRVGGKLRFEGCHLARRLVDPQLAVVVHHRDTGGIVAPVFQTAQAFHENFNDVALGNGPDDATHRSFLFGFPGPLPAGDVALLAPGHGEFIRCHIPGDGGTGTHRRASAHGDRRHQGTVGADEGAVANGGGEFVDPIVVAGDGAGADIDPLAKGGVTDVAEVVDLAAGADHRLLGLDEIADPRPLAEYRAGPQPGEGPHLDTRRQGHGPLDHGVGLDDCAVADLRIADQTVGSDGDVPPQADPAFKDAVDVDKAVLPRRQLPPAIEASGIGEANPLGHQGLGLTALVVTLEALQLLAAVDPLGLFPGLRLVGVDQQPLFMGDGDQIGEVILTLGVAVAYGGQPGGHAPGGHRHHPGVDLGDELLQGAGVLLLDDAGDVA